MRHSYQIRYKRVFLRPLEEGDIEELRILRNRNREFFNDSRVISPEQQRAWFRRYLEQSDDVMFAVELAGDPGKFIGATAIYNIDPAGGTAEWGRLVIDREKTDLRGLGAEAVAASCHIAFAELGVEKLVCELFRSNEPARRTYIRAGGVTVGEDEKRRYMEMTPDTIAWEDD